MNAKHCSTIAIGYNYCVFHLGSMCSIQYTLFSFKSLPPFPSLPSLRLSLPPSLSLNLSLPLSHTHKQCISSNHCCCLRHLSCLLLDNDRCLVVVRDRCWCCNDRVGGGRVALVRCWCWIGLLWLRWRGHGITCGY